MATLSALPQAAAVLPVVAFGRAKDLPEGGAYKPTRYSASLRSLLDLDGRVIRAEIIRFDRRYAILDTGFKGNSRFDRRNLKPSQLVWEAPVRAHVQSTCTAFCCVAHVHKVLDAAHARVGYHRDPQKLHAKASIL